jgi:cardiolipin synthase
MSVFIQWLIFLVVTAMAVTAAGHALLYKRDPRASLGWIAVCFLFPAVGPVLYFLFGINRIKIKADRLESYAPFQLAQTESAHREDPEADILVPQEFRSQARISRNVSGRPLLGGNAVKALHNGEEAFPEMIEAVNSAEETCYLSSYIFESNKTGRDFTDALSGAVKRGVDVRVVIDGLGEKYSLPWSGRLLRKAGVPVARFLPPTVIPPQFSINLRNHRKILVCDGHTAFVGGMNIGDRHLVDKPVTRSPVADMHFCVKGPVVSQIEEVFLWDWGYTTGDYAEPHHPRAQASCCAACRCISDGPNEEMDKLGVIIAGAISSARRKVRIMTPYFLPPGNIISALQTASLRGADVAVILPSNNNLPYVHWASMNMLWELLQRGIHVYIQPPPFNHTKLLTVDNRYVHVGSANLDPRSLRLNFELGLEIYDRDFARRVNEHFDAVRGRSNEITLDDVDSRSLPVRLRDSLCWLFSPYL